MTRRNRPTDETLYPNNAQNGRGESYGDPYEDRGNFGESYSGRASLDAPYSDRGNFGESYRSSRYHAGNESTHENLGFAHYSSRERSGQAPTALMRGKAPKGYKRSDDRIREDICDTIESQSSIDASEVEVSVVDGEVTLTGFVTERSMKYGLEQICDGVSGVKDIHNQVRVARVGEDSRTAFASREAKSDSKMDSGSKMPSRVTDSKSKPS